MKNNIIIANWKMSLSHKEAQGLLRDLIKKYNIKEQGRNELVICPSFVTLAEASKKIAETKMILGAQDCFWEDEGPFTGEVSPTVLKELGCQYVIIGHSERRKFLTEDDEMINKKVKSALKNDLAPVVCVGEKFEERQVGDKDFIIMQQVKKALNGVELNKGQKLIVAYEPVWVIGSGQAVSSEEAEHTNQVVRQILLDQFPVEVMDNQVYLIYGGSINLYNIKQFLNEATIDGALIGTASLEAESFWGLVKAAA
ncbi:triose-phosphate isomerase [Patescibacteria group bacterium]|nr:triose-phosphate isomerase [Patescibacteria group bacterium]